MLRRHDLPRGWPRDLEWEKSVLPTTRLHGGRQVSRAGARRRARRLGERGINVEIVMPTGFVGGRVTVAFGVDDPQGAAEALGDLAVTGATAI